MNEKNIMPENENKAPVKAKKTKAIKNSFKTRAFKAGSYSFVISVIAVAIAVIINVLVAQLPSKVTRRDLTANSYFTISDLTRQVVESLEEKVEIYWLVDTGSEDTYLEELLRRYDDLSDNIKVEKIDYVIFPSFSTAYTDETVTNNSVIVACGDNSRYVDYSYIYVEDYAVGDGESIKTLDFEGESAITSAINTVTGEENAVIYQLTGHGEDELSTYSEELQKLIEKENFSFQTINLNKYEAVPEDCACILLISPKRDLTPDEVTKLTEYLEKGGRMTIVSDIIDVDTPNYDAFLAYYGVEMVEGLIVENDSNYHNSNGQLYLLPEMSNHVITKPLADEDYTVLLPGAQGISFRSDVREGVYYGRFLNTSESSYAKADGYKASTLVYEEGDRRGPFTVATTITETVDGNTMRMCLYTTSFLLNDSANEMVSGVNFDLFVNSLNWVCNRENKISIRAKSMNLVPLQFTGTESNRLTLIMVIIIPLIPLAIGAVVTTRRRRR